MSNPEIGSREPEETQQQAEARNLQEALEDKGFVETHVAEVQTRKAPLRGAGNPELKRGEIFRFERGQILKGYKILREQIREAKERGEDTTEKRILLKEIRDQAKVLEKNLDEIERQCYENVRVIDVDTEFGKFAVPVVELDLRKKEDKESKKDDRTPYFFIPGMPTADFHNSVAVSMAMALEGNRVFVPIDIEQSPSGKPENFREMLKERGDLGIHAEVFKQIIRAVGLDKVNVMGHSFGATIALELGTDPDFKELQDLVIMEPLGIEEKGVVKLAAQFGFSQSLLKFLPYAEQRIKVAKGVNTKARGDNALYLQDVQIIAKELYPVEKLSQIKPNGRFQVWFGTDSPIMNVDKLEEAFLGAEELRGQDPNASPLEIYEVDGGEHMWPVRNALGLARMLAGGRSGEQITHVNTKDLKNSAMAGIIQGKINKNIK